MLITEAAAVEAERVRENYWHEASFPIDPFEIARRLGIDTYVLDLEGDASGMIVAKPGGSEDGLEVSIFVDASNVPARRNFTCAHELGHYAERVLRTGKAGEAFAFRDSRTSKSDAHELYANEFAGNLLMPEYEVTRLHGLQTPVIRMAKHFDVSIPAMQVRLQRLGLTV